MYAAPPFRPPPFSGAGTARVLLLLAEGVRLPYMLVTSCWVDLAFHAPVQVQGGGRGAPAGVARRVGCRGSPLLPACRPAGRARVARCAAAVLHSPPRPPPAWLLQLALVLRALKDNEAQCATPYFKTPEVGGGWRCLTYACCARHAPNLGLQCRTCRRDVAACAAVPAGAAVQVQLVLQRVAQQLTSMLSTGLTGAGIPGPQVRPPPSSLRGWLTASACCAALGLVDDLASADSSRAPLFSLRRARPSPPLLWTRARRACWWAAGRC